MLRLALAQVRTRPAAFAAVAVTALLTVATTTAVASLLAADAAAPGGSGTRLGTIARVFGEGAILVASLVTVNCVGFAVRCQARDLALLRTIAATPRQAHRLVRWEALVVTAAVAPAGWLAGSFGAGWFLGALRRHGYAPPAAEVPATPLPHLLALAVTAAVAVAASAVGAWRVARLPPAAALAGTGVERRGVGRPRAVLGSLALADAGALVGVNVAAGGPDAVDGAFLALLMLMTGVGLLGPVLVAAAARVLGAVPRRLSPRVGWLADANVRGHAQRLAAAVIPVALLVGLACNFLFVGATMEGRAPAGLDPDVRGFADPDENWLRRVELAMFVLVASVAVVNTLVALTAERRRELGLLRLLGATGGDLWRMLLVETGLVVVIGLGLGTGVGAITLTTFSLGATGSPVPSVPMAPYAAVVAATVALAAPSVLLAGRWAIGDGRDDRALAARAAR